MELLSHMALFVEVVRQRSFVRAAAQLQMPVSTLSRRISEFEKQLGLKLLHRSTRKVEPTHEGMQYYLRCAPLVQEALLAHEDLSSARDGVAGLLRVSCTSDFASLYLQDMLDTFLPAHPQLQMQLDLTVRRVDLLTEPVDVALRLGQLENSSLVARHVADFPAALYASPLFIQAHGMPGQPQDLPQWACLRMGAEDPFGQWRLVHETSPKETVQVQVQGRLMVNSMHMLAHCCAQGHGIALLDVQAAHAAVQRGALVRVLPQWRGVGTSLHLVTASRMVPARVRVFTQALLAHFSS